jgi:hypothetical protein
MPSLFKSTRQQIDVHSAGVQADAALLAHQRVSAVVTDGKTGDPFLLTAIGQPLGAHAAHDPRILNYVRHLDAVQSLATGPLQ